MPAISSGLHIKSEGRMMKTTKSLLALLTVLGSLTAQAQSSPTPEILPLSSRIQGASQDILNFITDQLTADNCDQKLELLNTTLFEVKSSQFSDISNVTENNGQDAISVLFEARTELNEKLRAFVSGKVDGKKFKSQQAMVSCVDQMRRAHRNIRGLEDRVALSSLRKQNKLKNLGLVGMPSADLGLKPFEDNQWPNLMLNKKLVQTGTFSRASLRTGDFFMTKGTTFASSVISRIGRIDNQFSHLAVVYIDDGSLFGEKNKGKIYVVESEPDFGLQIVSLDHFFKNDKNRIVHYRLNWVNSDASLTPASDVAAVAAKYLASKADVRENTFDKSKTDTTMNDRLDIVEKLSGVREIKRIGYNFGMAMTEENTLFCSQIVSYGLKYACSQPGVKCESFPELGNKGPDIFPLVQSEIVTKNNGFAKLLNLTISKTFAPADAEVEPRFAMLGEWRDVSYSAYTRVQDMATTKLFQLMEEGQYEFIESDELKAFADVTTKMLKDAGKMPHDMPDGLTKGSLYTAFLTWYSGPGRLITDMIEKADAQTILDFMISTAGLQKETALLLMSDQGSALEKGEKVKALANRIAKHKSLVGFLQEMEEVNLKQNGFYITEKQMSNVLDAARKADCELYKKLASGEIISSKNKESGLAQRNTVVIHDLIRRNTNDINASCETKAMPLSIY